MTNITTCEKCRSWLIFEELENHVCGQVIDYKIRGDILLVFDGFLWYPLNLSHQPKGNRWKYQPSRNQNLRQQTLNT